MSEKNESDYSVVKWKGYAFGGDKYQLIHSYDIRAFLIMIRLSKIILKSFEFHQVKQVRTVQRYQKCSDFEGVVLFFPNYIFLLQY